MIDTSRPTQPSPTIERAASERAGRLTPDGLVIAELGSKRAAVHAYDSIIWKVRTGYAIVLYTGLGLIYGDVLGLKDLPSPWRISVGLLFIVSLSIAAAAIDLSFLRGKLRVVERKNELPDLALTLSTCSGVEADKLRRALRHAGEDPSIYISSGVCRDAIQPLIPLYLAVPVLAAVALVLMTLALSFAAPKQ